ncbi:MAG: TVP38/TMEM64 family protein, partial [Gammaproteobacteria bacterium]
MLTKRGSIKLLLLLSMLLFLVVTLFSMDIMTIENIKHNKVQISRFIADHYSLSVVLFYLSCAVFINSPVPFAAVVKLLGGFFFGFHLGAVYNITATILACLVGF